VSVCVCAGVSMHHRYTIGSRLTRVTRSCAWRETPHRPPLISYRCVCVSEGVREGVRECVRECIYEYTASLTHSLTH
jgi:hypothetical protein